MEITKNLTSTFNFIAGLESDYQMYGLPFNDRICKVALNIRNLRLDFNLKVREALSMSNTIVLNDFIIQNMKSNRRYIIPQNNNYLNGTINIAADEDAYCQYSITVSHIMEEGWKKEKKYFYRFVLPIESAYWIRDINTMTYHMGDFWSRGLIPINFNEGTVHVYPIRKSDANYMVIESQFASTYDDMNKYLYAISLALGLVTSTITFDYAYLFAGDDDIFDKNVLCGFMEMRPTVKGQYQFFTTNMYSLEDAVKRNGANYALSQLYDEHGNLCPHLQDWIQLIDFEQITLMLYKNEALARAVLTLIESSNMSLDYEGAMCAVALETICSALYRPQQKALMENGEWQNVVRPKFENLIRQLETEQVISKEHAETMRRKLNNLNTATNADKLSQPFASVGYNLTKSDKKNIERRNRFLHGNIVGHTQQESFDEILYTCMELQKLCVVLLFRNAGFNGLIVNNAVLMGLKNAVKDKEPILIG